MRTPLTRLFGQRIRELRLEQGLRATDVAAHLGVDSSHYYGIEAGRNSPSFEVLLAMSKVLRVDEADLFTWPGTGPRHDLREQIRVGPPPALAELRTTLEAIAPLPERDPAPRKKPKK
jgi:transcriptional regulator with XRE-family HTH domain